MDEHSPALGFFDRCLFYLRVHFSANENGGTGQIKPQEKSNHCANGSIRDGETVEEAEIQFESKRDHQPEHNPHDRARHEPVPSAVFNIWSVKVEDIECHQHETE